MKKFLCLFAVLGLLMACQGKENPSGGDDNSGGNKEVVATAIKLNKNELTLEKGANETLTVAFTPSNVTNKVLTWASSNKSIADVTDGNVVAVDAGSTEIVVRQGDLTDKCTVTVVISAKTITLDKDSIELTVGGSETITATVEPAGATDKIEWSSSAEDIATVNAGVVTAQAIGTATITAKAGSQTATCEVVVKGHFKIEAVDLGLSVKWANANIGAKAPEEYGDKYAWGETETKEDYSWATYKWGNGENMELTKYNTSILYGTVDNKTVLDSDDDAAHVVLGGKWRMPTHSEQEELVATKGDANYQWAWELENGHYGWLITYLKNNNSIFLPTINGKNYDSGSYWSNSLYSNDPSHAQILSFQGGYVSATNVIAERRYGKAIRPVSD